MKMSTLPIAPVKGPFEQEELGSLRKGRTVLVGLQDLGHHTIQPRSPLLQGVLLLEGQLEVLLQPLDNTVFTPAHP